MEQCAIVIQANVCLAVFWAEEAETEAVVPSLAACLTKSAKMPMRVIHSV